MAVFDRKMFRNTGAMPPVKGPSSRGVGITSGLVPIKPIKMAEGGSVYDRIYDIYSKAVPEQKGFFQQNAPALLNFFASLSEAGAGGRPLTSAPESPFAETLRGISYAAPALADIKPYQDPAAVLAAQTAAEFEVESELENLKKKAPELKNTDIVQREITIPDPNDPEKTITELHNFLIGTIGNEVYEQDLGIAYEKPDVENTVLVKKPNAEGVETQYIVGFKNGKPFETEIGPVIQKIENVKISEVDGKRVVDYTIGNNFGQKIIGNADTDFVGIGTEDVKVGDRFEKRYYYRENDVLKYDVLGERVPSDTVIVNEKKREEAKETIQSAWQAFQEKQGLNLGDLTEKQIDRTYASVGDDEWTEVTDKGKLVNKIEGFFFQTLVPEFDKKEIAKATGEVVITDDTSGNEITLSGNFDPNIVKTFNLDPKDPNFSIQYSEAQDRYNDLPRIESEAVDSVNKNISNIKTLAAIKEVSSAGIPVVGEFAASMAKLGFPIPDGTSLTQFVTERDALDLQAVDQLIKGVPSNIDLRKVENLTPKAGEIEQVTLQKIKMLDAFFTQLILDRIAFSAGKGEIIPTNLLMDVRELVGNEAVDEALGKKWTPQRLQDFNNLSTNDYFKKYGDPLEKSNSILGRDIESFDEGKKEISPAEDEYMKNLLTDLSLE